MKTPIIKNMKSWTPGLKDINELLGKVEKLLVEDAPKQAQQLASCIENSELPVFKVLAKRWPEIPARVQRKLVRPLVKGWMSRESTSCVTWLCSELKQINGFLASNQHVAYEQQLLNGLANAVSLNLVSLELESKLFIEIKCFLEQGSLSNQINAKHLTRLDPWLDALSRFKSAKVLEFLEVFLRSNVSIPNEKTQLWLPRLRANVTDTQGSLVEGLSFENWLKVIEDWLKKSPKRLLMFKVIPGLESFFKEEYKTSFESPLLTNKGVIVGKPSSKKIREILSHRFYLEVGLLIELPKASIPQHKFDWMIELSNSVEKATSSKAPMRVRMADLIEIRSEKEKIQKSLLELYPHVVATGRGAHWQLEFENAFNGWSLFPKTRILASHDVFRHEVETYAGKSQDSLAWFLSRLANRHVKPRSNVLLEVLDPFCGTGTELLCMIDAFGGKIKTSLTGVDVSDQAISISQRRIQAALESDARFISGELKLESKFVCKDTVAFLKGSHHKFDLIITNPPFGMRTSRGVARDLMQSFFKHVSVCLADKGVLVIVAHAASSFVSWGTGSGLKLLASHPLLLGKMKVEAQVWTKSSQR